LASRLKKSKNSTRISASNLAFLQQPTLHTSRSSGDSNQETPGIPESKPKSTSSDELAVDPGNAPLAIDSPGAILNKQDLRGADNTQAVINVEKIGPWLIVITFALGAALCALIMILAFGPTYVDAMIQKAVAQAETRIRTETAQETAKANATAHVARTSALVAVDKVEDVRVKLAQKNIDLPPLDGH